MNNRLYNVAAVEKNMKQNIQDLTDFTFILIECQPAFSLSFLCTP